MRKDKTLHIGDMAIILSLVYVYLWRVGTWYSGKRAILTVFFFVISAVFYIYTTKALRLNHWAVLLGTIVFSFCGSDVSLVFPGSILPYPGILPILISLLCLSAANKRILLLWVFSLVMFILSAIGIVLHVPVWLISSARLLFNFAMGVIVAYGASLIFEQPQNSLMIQRFTKTRQLLSRIWLYSLLILLPLAYAILVLFLETGRFLIPNIIYIQTNSLLVSNIVSCLVAFEFFSGWFLVITSDKAKVISDIIPFLTIFLASADIFSWWVAAGV